MPLGKRSAQCARNEYTEYVVSVWCGHQACAVVSLWSVCYVMVYVPLCNNELESCVSWSMVSFSTGAGSKLVEQATGGAGG